MPDDVGPRLISKGGRMASFLPKIIALTGFVLLSASVVPAFAQCASPKNVSGVWKANDGGTYRLHVVGSTIWWVGMSGDGGNSWTNVFKGTRNGNVIDGQWADVGGRAWGHGTLKLQISGTTFMEKLGGTGSGFGGSRWGRGGCNDTEATPAQ